MFDPENDVVTPLEGCAVLNLSKRIQTKQFALTYPRCDVTPQDVLSNILSKEYGLGIKPTECVVARETHKDGAYHIHVYLIMSDSLRYTDREGSYWNFATGQHGNYQRMRSQSRWLRYVSKDNEYVVFPEDFDVAAKLSSAKNHQSYQHEVIAKSIIEDNVTPEDVMLSNPGFFLMNSSKVISFHTLYHQSMSNKTEKLAWPENAPLHMFSSAEAQIFVWCKQVKTGNFDRDVQHLRIRGPTGVGKTSLLLQLQKFLKIYMVPDDNGWYIFFFLQV